MIVGRSWYCDKWYWLGDKEGLGDEGILWLVCEEELVDEGEIACWDWEDEYLVWELSGDYEEQYGYNWYTGEQTNNPNKITHKQIHRIPPHPPIPFPKTPTPSPSPINHNPILTITNHHKTNSSNPITINHHNF